MEDVRTAAGIVKGALWLESHGGDREACRRLRRDALARFESAAREVSIEVGALRAGMRQLPH
jgi:hypothetical protein